jgi:molecular chaperone GrpE
MAKAREDTEEEELLAIDIDPSVIEAALAAVDSRKRGGGRRDTQSELDARAGIGGEESDRQRETAELEVELPEEAPLREPPRPQAPVRATEAPNDAGEDERKLLQIRLREQQEKVRRLELELARAVESRDTIDQQFRDLRQSAQRLQQEMDLLRQRGRKDRDDAERTGEERVLRGLLDIVDNVERGVNHANQDPTRVLAGLTMIAEQFRMLVKRLGIERIDASRGSPFDPSRHEAVLHMPTGDVPPDTVHSEVAAGFVLRGRLLRPARVVVASALPEPVPDLGPESPPGTPPQTPRETPPETE